MDAARGIAVLMMVFYHLMYDLGFLGFTYVAFTPPYEVLFDAFQIATAGLFLSLVGVSLSISSGRYERQTGRPYPFGHLAKRGLRIFAWGLLVSAVTRLAVGPIYVRFGILHFIGVSIVVAYPFLRHPRLCLPIAAVVLVLGMFLGRFEVGFPWLLWLGLAPAGQEYVDYFPLLPWFSIVLGGVFLGHRLYPEGRRAFNLANSGGTWSWRCLAFLGRHSLLIYLTHQPVLVLLLAAIRPQAVLGLL